MEPLPSLTYLENESSQLVDLGPGCLPKLVDVVDAPQDLLVVEFALRLAQDLHDLRSYL